MVTYRPVGGLMVTTIRGVPVHAAAGGTAFTPQTVPEAVASAWVAAGDAHSTRVTRGAARLARVADGYAVALRAFTRRLEG